MQTRTLSALRWLAAPLLALPLWTGTAQASDSARCADPDAAPSEAVRACDRLLASGRLSVREQARALVNQGAAWIALGSYSQAITAFNSAERRDPRIHLIYTNRGYAHARLNQLDDALADYGRALAMQPGDPLALMERGALLLRMGRAKEALADFDALLRRAPQDADVRFNRALALTALGRTEDAVRALTRLTVSAPGDAAVWMELGRARMASDPATAIKDLTEAIRLAPEWAEAHMLRGQIYDGLGQTARADRDFLRAYELGYQSGWLTERVAGIRNR
ncbi:MAG: tetratricopeptide repeat protein [Pseudomonadota bacterium]